MQCICCKCGALADSDNTTLCLPMISSTQGHQSHCFCCAQPPRLKCIHCNMWRELDVMEEHGACRGGSLHVFVYSEPWPPFPDDPPMSPLRVMPAEPQVEYEGIEFQADEYQSNDMEEIVDLSNDGNDLLELKPTSAIDLKPRIIKNPRWVTIVEISRWTHCYRCGQVRSQKKGWLRHAQQCGQDPAFNKAMFFIHLHTKSWCGFLVRDVFWDKHSDPTNGDCEQCRLSRLNKLPLPYQPKAPPRKNEAYYERKRRIQMVKKRKKRRETVTFDKGVRNVVQIEDSIDIT